MRLNDISQEASKVGLVHGVDFWNNQDTGKTEFRDEQVRFEIEKILGKQD